MQRIFRIICFVLKLIAASTLACVIKFFSKNMRNIWIISERGDDARDNGFFFFEYMREAHPEQKIFYIIKEESADYPKVIAIGEAIEPNSFRHFLYYSLCDIRISSSMWGGDLPCVDYFQKARNIIGKKKKFVFLKHGIVKDFLPQHCAYSGSPNLYICGAKPEYDYVRSNFGHPEGVVQYTGLARFDNLHNIQTKRQILVMPTFRRWLQKMNDEEVKESEYIANWNQLLNDDRITGYLETFDIDLIFYPHYVMQKHIKDFHATSKRIIIAKFDDYDVQTLLIESKLLITDFSSVFFDFGYMNKPVIYYQFDRDRYIAEHYDFTKGYFSYEKDGFGDVVTDINALINAILECINNDMKLSSKYRRRINNFFPLNDQKNSERIYEKILSL